MQRTHIDSFYINLEVCYKIFFSRVDESNTVTRKGRHIKVPSVSVPQIS